MFESGALFGVVLCYSWKCNGSAHIEFRIFHYSEAHIFVVVDNLPPYNYIFLLIPFGTFLCTTNTTFTQIFHIFSVLFYSLGILLLHSKHIVKCSLGKYVFVALLIIFDSRFYYNECLEFCSFFVFVSVLHNSCTYRHQLDFVLNSMNLRILL